MSKSNLEEKTARADSDTVQKRTGLTPVGTPVPTPPNGPPPTALWPYVAPAAGCRTVWLPPAIVAAGEKPGANSANGGQGGGDGDGDCVWLGCGPEIGDVPAFRVTPAVLAFVRRKLLAAEDSVHASDARLARDPDDIRAAGWADRRGEVVAALAKAAARWRVVEAWAAATFAAAELGRAWEREGGPRGRPAWCPEGA